MNGQHPYKQRWTHAWNQPIFRIQFAITIAFLLCMLFFIPYFFNYIQLRNGKQLNDPLLNLVGPVDVSWITFTFIYVSLLAALISLSYSPQRLLMMMQAYCIVTFLRLLSILVVSLNEPAGIIVLNDPLVAIIGYNGKVITKDLFFSGHVSTTFLLYLCVGNRQLKVMLLFATLIIACLILIQHVHYTIDVIVAPLFAFIAFRSATYLQLKFR